MPMALDRFLASLRDTARTYNVVLTESILEKLARYYALLLKWNERLHLVAPCSPEEFGTRHVLESLMVVRHLSPDACVADIGSGAGLPIIPCLVAREDIQAVLFESSKRKTVFLREALKAVECQDRAEIVPRQFQVTKAPKVQFVTCRAIDQFERLLPALIEWSPPMSTLLLFGGESIVKQLRRKLNSVTVERLPGSERRFLALAQNTVS